MYKSKFVGDNSFVGVLLFYKSFDNVLLTPVATHHNVHSAHFFIFSKFFEIYYLFFPKNDSLDSLMEERLLFMHGNSIARIRTGWDVAYRIVSWNTSLSYGFSHK